MDVTIMLGSANYVVGKLVFSDKKISLFDRVLGLVVAIYFGYHKIFGGKQWKCGMSPDGSHLWVASDCKYGCKYCQMPKPRVQWKD